MTGSTVHLTASAEATEKLGRELAARLEPGDVLLLGGELAAGKTTLVRGLAEGLGADPDEVSSPTFVIVQTYLCGGHGSIERLHHVDLYRLHHRGELMEIGLEELFGDPAAVTAVEWARELVARDLPPGGRVWRVDLEPISGPQRRITIRPPASGTGG